MSDDGRIRFAATLPDHARTRANRRSLLPGLIVLGFVAVLALSFGGTFLAQGFAPTHAQPGPVRGDTPLDFTVIWGWLFVGALAVVGLTIAAWYFGSGVAASKVAGGVAVGFVIVIISILGATFNVFVPAAACATSNCNPQQIAGVGAVAVSLPFSASYPTGQTLVVSPLSVTVDTVMNSSTAAGTMCLQNGVGASHACLAASHNYFVLPVKLSRTDNYNATLGWTICINSIATLTNSSTGIQYADVGYVPSTTSSPGVWKVQWSTGSIGSANPTQPAPATTSGVACDLVGVPAFGSATATLSVSLPGSNGTSANFGYLATQYSTYGFSISISGGTGASPASVPVNIVFTGTKAV